MFRAWVRSTLSTPISIYEVKPRVRLDTVPTLIANPRSLIVLGRDTLAGLYVEGYGLPASARVNVAVLNDAHVVILRDTVNLVRQGELSSALLDFPVQSIGVGPVTVVTSLAGTADTVQAPLFLSFGDEFGITSFDDLLSYLRYFVSPQRIQALRDTPPEQRAAAWASFWKQTDPNPSTPDNEALRDYFKRIATANSRYREEGMPGWLTDRGKVYVTLGEPDQAGQPLGSSGSTARSRAEIWVYTQYNLAPDLSESGRWSPATFAIEPVRFRQDRASSAVAMSSRARLGRRDFACEAVDRPYNSACVECDLHCIVLTKNHFAPI